MTFTDLYPQLLADCRRLARRLLHDDDLAEQTAAEALLRLYEHRDQLAARDTEHHRAWTLRVTRNLAMDEIRRRARHSPLDATDLASVDNASESVLRVVLLEALAELPRGQRRSIELRYLQDLSQAATAEALGVQAGTVATHVSRALGKLRRQLAEVTTTPRKDLPMNITTLAEAKRLIGTDRVVTAHIVDRLGKDRFLARTPIPAVYRRRGQLGGSPDTAEIECVVIDMYDDQLPLITDRITPSDDIRKRLDDLRPGSRAVGIVTTIVGFGAIVEFDGLRGLIHSSDLLEDPAVGQQVEVTAVDATLGRIGLRPAD